MNILITGGAGFIGSHLSDYLISEGHNVTILDDLSSGKIKNVPTNAKLFIGDINDVDLLSKIFKDIDFCYHLAAIPSVQKSVDCWAECHKVNLTGTINIFLEASKYKVPVIYASSAAVYGDLNVLPLSEDSLVNLLSPYGVDKYSCELQASVFGKVYGLKSVGLRFFNVYGPRQDPNSPYSGVISIFSDNIKNDAPLNIYGDGTQSRDFIFIKDVIKCLVLARDNISQKPEVYNVCTGYGVQITELNNSLFDVFGKKVPINYLERREGDIYRSLGCPEKAKSSIGFIASTSLLEGLRILSKEI